MLRLHSAQDTLSETRRLRNRAEPGFGDKTNRFALANVLPWPKAAAGSKDFGSCTGQPTRQSC